MTEDEPTGEGPAESADPDETPVDPPAESTDPDGETVGTEAASAVAAGSDAGVGSGAGASLPARGADDENGIRRLILWGALLTLSLLALVALGAFYLNASAAINRWVAPEYRRLVQAAFNLVVLLLSGVGIALVVRELND